MISISNERGFNSVKLFLTVLTNKKPFQMIFFYFSILFCFVQQSTVMSIINSCMKRGLFVHLFFFCILFCYIHTKFFLSGFFDFFFRIYISLNQAMNITQMYVIIINKIFCINIFFNCHYSIVHF